MRDWEGGVSPTGTSDWRPRRPGQSERLGQLQGGEKRGEMLVCLLLLVPAIAALPVDHGRIY